MNIIKEHFVNLKDSETTTNRIRAATHINNLPRIICSKLHGTYASLWHLDVDTPSLLCVRWAEDLPRLYVHGLVAIRCGKSLRQTEKD